MRVLIDAIHLGKEMKGVGIYVFNVLNILAERGRDIRYTALVLEGTSAEYLPARRHIDYVSVPWRNHFVHGFRTVPSWTRKVDPDVVWIPYDTPVAPAGRPYLMLCHDVPARIRAARNRSAFGGVPVRDRFVNIADDYLLSRALRRAAMVFSNSAYVARWLRDEVKVDERRIRHAPCAPGADFRALSRKVNPAEVRERIDAPEGYILTFDTGDPRENFEIVPEVFRRIVDAGLPHRLVVAGVRDHLRKAVESRLSSHEWYGRVRIVPFLGADRVQELADLYTAASIYLDPSLHEGFGMQVVEAMTCGTPVVCSDRGALPEVAGDGACLVNPEDEAEIASAILKIICGQDYRKLLSGRALARSKVFSWSVSAETIHEGIVAVSGGRPHAR